MPLFQSSVVQKYLRKDIEIKTNIDQTDKEIDLLVYEFYQLSEEEIRVIEGR